MAKLAQLRQKQSSLASLNQNPEVVSPRYRQTMQQTDAALRAMQDMVSRLQPHQAYMNQLNSSLMGQLNRPVERMRDQARGVSSTVDMPSLEREARNVLQGRHRDSGANMRPLNIPGMTQVGNQMIPNNRLPQPSQVNVPQRGLGNMTPNQFRDFQQPGGMTRAQAAGYGAGNAGYDILKKQQDVAQAPLETAVSAGYSGPTKADWAARAARQSARKAYTRAGGRGSYGFRQFTANQNQRNTPSTAPSVTPPTSKPPETTPLASNPEFKPVKTAADFLLLLRQRQEKRASILRRVRQLVREKQGLSIDTDEETTADPLTDAANLRKLQEQTETKVAECDDCQQTETCDTCKQTPCNCDAIAKLAKDMARLMLGTQCKTCSKAQCTCGRTASPTHDLAQ